jgi:hypothetical protein
MQEGEVTTIVGMWLEATLDVHKLDLPVDDVRRALRVIPRTTAWALSEDALVLMVLNPDGTLHTLVVTEDGQLESTLDRHLKGEPMIVSKQPRPAESYQDTETVQETAWSFAYINGEPILGLTGRAWTDRYSGRQRRDERQRLAEELEALAQRNAA